MGFYIIKEFDDKHGKINVVGSTEALYTFVLFWIWIMEDSPVT